MNDFFTGVAILILILAVIFGMGVTIYSHFESDYFIEGD